MRIDSAPPGADDACVTMTPGAAPWSVCSSESTGVCSTFGVTEATEPGEVGASLRAVADDDHLVERDGRGGQREVDRRRLAGGERSRAGRSASSRCAPRGRAARRPALSLIVNCPSGPRSGAELRADDGDGDVGDRGAGGPVGDRAGDSSGPGLGRRRRTPMRQDSERGGEVL